MRRHGASASPSSSSSSSSSAAQTDPKQYCRAIEKQTGVSSVGEMRGFTDVDFRSLEVPAMLRIYLKHLLRGSQSGRIGNSSSSGNSSKSSDPHITSLQN